MPEHNKPQWTSQAEGRTFTRIDVTTMLNGATLKWPLHMVAGRKPGPTLGIITNVHGDEFLRSAAIRLLLDQLDTATMSGRLAVISVANPMAMAAFGRQTPEQHGKTDLHEVFPGNAKGNTTQMIAAAITANLLDHVDALIDFHSGGQGGRLQSRVDFNAKAPEPVKARCLELSRAFGAAFVHENDLSGTAAHYLNAKGIPTANPEIGGSYLGPDNTALYMQQGIEGIRGIMVALGMLSSGGPKHMKQIQFDTKARHELRPKHSGCLVSLYESPGNLGQLIAKGVKLGEVIDLYSYEVLEEIVAPFDGYLFFSRYSGVVGGGTQA